MTPNNYYCYMSDCSYKTAVETEELADAQLIEDGGFDTEKETQCPICKRNSLVFIASIS